MLSLDVSRFLNNARSLRNNLRLAAEGHLTERAAVILNEVRDKTPPSSTEKGEQAVERDVHNVIQEVSDDHARPQDVAAIVKPYRVGGRIPARISPRIRVRYTDARRYIDAEKARVGTLKNAWKYQLETTGNITRIKLLNTCSFASQVPGLAPAVNAVLAREIRQLDVSRFRQILSQSTRNTLTII